MKKILIYYNFIIISLLIISSFISAETYSHLVSSMLFYPLFIYFGLKVFPKRNKAIILPAQEMRKAKVIKSKPKRKKTEKSTEVIKLKKEKVDIDRRMFLKLIGSAGASLFLFSIFTKKAEAAFFGSVPGPGTVSIKDTTGTQIDPAVKHPTDGYRISRLDDSVPAYYGFTNKDAAWFIMKEDASGNYTYAVGSSGFDSNWSNRDQSPPTGPTYGEYYEMF